MPSPPPSTPSILGLTPDRRASFHENGYLVIPNYLSQKNLDDLLSTTHHLLSNFDLTTHPLTRFTTGDSPTSPTHVGDSYFLTSGDKIRFFFEPDAFQPPDSAHPNNPPTLTRAKNLAINKIGHSLHTLSPPFSDITLSARTAEIARDLNFKDPRVLQSMVICKQPGIGAAVPPHKDSEFLYTDPPSAVGWWIALQDAGPGNGGLGMWKGSHKRGYINRRFVRVEGGEGGTEFIPWNGTGLARELQVGDWKEGEVYTPRDEDFELLDVKAGDLVLIHGNVLHKSERNTSGESRFAYTFHVIDGAEEYDGRNWLQPTGEEGFTRLFAD
ncbi:hypothetical protein FQN50_004144 [Emmonsiellopsis sp. PD_5]|nr:hypothetical protein FQN50_004144 [Emmonsiellopsis sp. PD_5]